MKPSRALDKAVRFIQTWSQHASINAGNFWKHIVYGRDRLRPVYAIYEMTYACNMDCTYCDDGTGNSYPRRTEKARPLTLDGVKSMLRFLRRELPSLYLCGGEPTIHPDFLPILSEIDRLGFYPVLLNTNGLMLPKLLERDPQLFRRIDILIISLDSTNPITLDRLYRSRTGDGQRVIDVIKKYKKPMKDSGCKLVVNCVVTEDTINDAMEVIKFCREEAIMLAPVPANRGMGLMHCFQDIGGYGSLVDKLLSSKGARLFGNMKVYEILMRFKNFECHPALRMHITPDGMVPWPCQSDQRFRLPILGYESLSALYGDAEKRFPVQGHGQRCKSRCYLVQNVSTHVYLNNPLMLTISAVRDLLLKI